MRARAFDLPGRFAWCRRLLYLLCLALHTSSLAAAGLALSNETELKAAFLLNFGGYVEWPEDRFAAPLDPLVIAVIDDAGFSEQLRRLAEGRRIAGRRVEVLALSATPSPAMLRSTHILFLPEKSPSLMMIPANSRRAVLTVGDGERFLEEGGVIRLVQVNRRLRFDISLQSAEQSGLRLSAKLLELARSVRGKRS